MTMSCRKTEVLFCNKEEETQQLLRPKALPDTVYL